ncbi:MAG TPA: cytosine permease, partial [Candidatus Wallbacteria bacterium]|nr:cytosine permease [Candidatus Wallbacteria bacterium]
SANDIEGKLKGLDAEKANLRKVESDLKAVTSAASDLNQQLRYIESVRSGFGDLTKKADQITGQILGLPTTMAFYAFVGVFGTLASIIVFNRAIWNPSELIDAFHSPILSLFGGFIIFLATITTNIAANVVAPANAFANLMPKKITYRAGVVITGIIGVLIMPWKLYSDPSGYIFNWLGIYGSFLGPLAGLYISDYYILRKQKLNLYDLYLDGSQYYNYTRGFNPAALITYFISIFPFCLDLIYNTFNGHVVNSSWIIGLFISLIVYPLFPKKGGFNFDGFDSVTDIQKS